jgi:N-acetylmuramoyl-L-alanine amidase
MMQSMKGQLTGREWKRCMAALAMFCLLVAPVFAASMQVRKEQARSQFDSAERMREELNGMSQQDRTRREYQRVMDAYRSVYYTSPASSKADASVVAVAELLAESGRTFNDEKSLRAAISQYEFLCREYPGSKFRFAALFTIAQIYKDDLQENDKARETFEEVIRRFPHLQQAADAREAISEMDQQPRPALKPADSRAVDSHVVDSHAADAHATDAKPVDLPAEAARSTLPLVTGIRHWSTPDYTRVAIDLDQEVKYEAGRVSNPDRIFFDLHDTKLASTLAGKTFDVSDSFLRRVRVAQFQKNMVRVVLEVDAVSDYSAFLLPNPYRLIIDIHGRKPNTPHTLVARAQQEEEKRVPSPTPQASATQPMPATEAAQESAKEAMQEVTLSSTTPPLPSNPEAAHQPLPATPHGPPDKPSPDYGPKMADGSFFSHAAENAGANKNAAQIANLPAVTRAEADTPHFIGPSEPAGEAASASLPAAGPAPAAGSAALPVSAVSATTPESTRAEVSNLEGLERKSTDKPTSEPTVEVVAPRGSIKSTLPTGKKNQREAEFRQAQPTADGQRSLIRALGLKVGRIVIDPGHGGHDTGTIGPGGLLEKDLVLDVSLRLGRLLQSKMGAEVVYTREDDTFIPLETRTAIANQQQADLFISVHANSSPDPSARGVETYYLNFNPSPDALEVAARENAVSESSVHELGDLVKKIALKEKVEESREFATDVDHALFVGLEGKDKSLRDRGVKKAPFIVLIGANMPSILAEISFVSNPGDERKLETPEYRQKIAESLYKGIARYINGLSGVKYASKTGDGQ